MYSKREIDMNTDLERAFVSFVDLFASNWRNVRSEKSGRNNLILFMHEDLKRRLSAEASEKSEQFKKLVWETCLSHMENHQLKEDELGTVLLKSERAAKHFFRRSGLYLDLFEGATMQIKDAFEKYCNAFDSTACEITYLAPLELVEFSRPLMDFGKFQIRRFNGEELGKILNSEINKVFYPWAYIDSEKLQDYWFIYLKETVPLKSSNYFEKPVSFREFIRSAPPRNFDMKFTEYPRSIEVTLKQLSLYGWQADWWRNQEDVDVSGLIVTPDKEMDQNWVGFKVPFYLCISDSLLQGPPRSPDTSVLELEDFNLESGEPFGDRLIYISLDETETEEFERFTKQMVKMLDDLEERSAAWKSLNNALNCLIKGFFSSGIDQMLWHRIALEAILGENRPGERRRIARRVACILEKEPVKRQNLEARLNELYDFRCKLVHGEPLNNQGILHGHVQASREFARRSTIWFINCLHVIQEAAAKNRALTEVGREDLLLFLDLKRGQRNRIALMKNILPREFPHVETWRIE